MLKNINRVKINILFVLLIISCFVILSSCAQESEININLKDLADVIAAKIDLSNTDEYSAEQIRTFYGIKPDDVVQIIVLKELNVNSAEVLILAEAVDKDKAKEIENKLKVSKTNKLNELLDYSANPDNKRQYYIVEGADIVVNGQYVFWAVYPQNKDIMDIINNYIKDSK